MASESRRYLIWLAVGMVAYLLVETCSLLSLYLLRTIAGLSYAPIRMSLSEKHQETVRKMLKDQTSYMRHDPELGWSIKKNGAVGQMYRANSDGIRSNRDYRLMPPNGMFRIASFGDSFTHGDDVRNEHTWQEFLASAKQNLEVMNFGVGAFGLDQAFLRYQRDGRQYGPHLVFIGFMSENIQRHVNVYRPFYFADTGLPLAKPRFVLGNGGIALRENPLKSLSNYYLLLRNPEDVLSGLGRYDWHYQRKPKESAFDILPSIRITRFAVYAAEKVLRPQIFQWGVYNEDAEAFELTLKIFDRFCQNVSKHGALPVLLLFPARADLKAYRENKRSVFAPMIRHFERFGCRYIDLHKAFDKYAANSPLKDMFVRRHYSPTANRVVAIYLADYIASNRLVDKR
ncbi:MAG: SGNH/GDSL hydrolase family protein [Alphaproteobacteria bacterium]|nr:SGNH/GDSL hydrolase family protein [Alphaproteobacteria bacterium]